MSRSQPRSLPSRENSDYLPNPSDIDCPRDRTDALTKIADEGVDDLGRHMCTGLGVLIEQAISTAEVEQVAIGPHEARPG